MKPRIGAISTRGLFVVVVSACLVAGARSALADGEPGEEHTPGPRPQAIPQTPMVLLDEPAVEETNELSAELEDDAADAPPQSPEPTAQGHDESELSLGLPALKPAHETQLLEAEAEPVESWLGSLDPRNNDIVRVLGALGIVIGLMLLLRTLARKFGGPLMSGGQPSGVLLVLARYPIARGQHLVLLKVGRRIVLCHQAKGVMATLSEIDGEDEVAAMLARIEAGSRGRDAARFEKMLEEFNQDHRRRTYTARGTSDARAALPQGPVIDLTKRASGGAANWLKLRRAAS